MNEMHGAAAFFRSRLVADSALAEQVGKRVYADFAPEVDPDDTSTPKKAPKYPLITYHMLTATDVNAGPYRVMIKPLFLVRVIAEGGYGAAQAAANRLDELLMMPDPVNVTVGSDTYTILGCIRERPVLGSDFDTNGKRYSYIGGHYRLYIQAA